MHLPKPNQDSKRHTHGGTQANAKKSQGAERVNLQQPAQPDQYPTSQDPPGAAVRKKTQEADHRKGEEPGQQAVHPELASDKDHERIKHQSAHGKEPWPIGSGRLHLHAVSAPLEKDAGHRQQMSRPGDQDAAFFKPKRQKSGEQRGIQRRVMKQGPVIHDCRQRSQDLGALQTVFSGLKPVTGQLEVDQFVHALVRKEKRGQLQHANGQQKPPQKAE
ncbi:MAG: hypothetical protein RLZZ253_2340 [Verrucomicrobiota bacterium]